MGVLISGAAHVLTNDVLHPAACPRDLGKPTNLLDEFPVCTTLFQGTESPQLYLRLRKGGPAMAKNKSFVIQDVPERSHPPEKSQRTTFKLKVFKILFKLIEALWMVVQIAQYIVEIFRR